MPNRPKPKKPPRNLRAVAGTDHVEPEEAAPKPKARLKPPPAPKWLPAAAVPIWDERARELVQRRMWSSLYEPMLASFCCLYAEMQADPSGMQTARVTQLRLLAGDLGFSPSHIDRVRRE